MSYKVFSENSHQQQIKLLSKDLQELKRHNKMIQDQVNSFDTRLISVTQLIKVQQQYIDANTPNTSATEKVLTDFLHKLNSFQHSFETLKNRISTFEQRLFFLENKENLVFEPKIEKEVKSQIESQVKELEKREASFNKKISASLNQFQQKLQRSRTPSILSQNTARIQNKSSCTDRQTDYLQLKIQELESKIAKRNSRVRMGGNNSLGSAPAGNQKQNSKKSQKRSQVYRHRKRTSRNSSRKRKVK